MPRTAQDVTDAELAVLQVLWSQGEATIRALREELYPEGSTSEYATVQKLLERLASKGYVLRRREGVAHVFRAAVPRDTLIGRRLEALVDKLCEGSAAPLITHLARSQRLTPTEADALRSLVDELDRRPARRKDDAS